MKTLYKYNNKKIARKAYNDGETILVYTSNVIPNNMWIGAYTINKLDGIATSTDFDTRINSFEFHNCNNENGYYSKFYVELSKP